MTGQAGSGRATTRPSQDEDGIESRSILTSVLLIAVIFAGFVIALSLAERDPMLTDTLSTILN